MKLVLGTDNEKGMKVALKLIDSGYKVEFLKLTNYPTVVKYTLARRELFAILICRSGIGMSIVANKFRGVYATLCRDEEAVARSRRRNNANVLCLGSDYHKVWDMVDMVELFITTKYEGKSNNNLSLIDEIERSNLKWKPIQ